MTRRERMRLNKEKRERQAKRKKIYVLLAAILVPLTMATVGSTLAYVASKTEQVSNSFDRAEMTCEITETFDGNIKSNVAIKNTSTQDGVAGYFRAAVIVSWENEMGVVYAKSPVAGTDYTIAYNLKGPGNDNGWIKGEDGYYYWPAEVAAGGSTGVLITTCQPVAGRAPEGYTLVVDILAQIIQSNPDSAVTDAWGFVPGGEGQ